MAAVDWRLQTDGTSPDQPHNIDPRSINADHATNGTDESERRRSALRQVDPTRAQRILAAAWHVFNASPLLWHRRFQCNVHLHLHLRPDVLCIRTLD